MILPSNYLPSYRSKSHAHVVYRCSIFICFDPIKHYISSSSPPAVSIMSVLLDVTDITQNSKIVKASQLSLEKGKPAEEHLTVGS